MPKVFELPIGEKAKPVQLQNLASTAWQHQWLLGGFGGEYGHGAESHILVVISGRKLMFLRELFFK
jgi:hypothetical protein